MIEKSIRRKLMGTAFSLGICADQISDADYWLERGVNEIMRIEALLSEYQPGSQTSKINDAQSYSELHVDEEVLDMICRSIQISTLTQGCFDITAAPLKNLYKFNHQHIQLPSEKEIKQVLLSVGYKNIMCNQEKKCIQKLVPGLKISFNAIGKGYAADAVKKMWKANGILSGFINASGDLCAFGVKPDGSHWKIAISNPDHKGKPLFYLPLSNQAIATSGDTEQHFYYNGKKYSHNINPHTGKPVTGIKSVSVISPSAELSDALATAVYVMGAIKGIDFVNQLPQTHGVIVDEKNQVFLSKHLKYEAIDHH